MGNFEKIKKELEERLREAADTANLEKVWRSYFGRKGVMSEEFKRLREATDKERKQMGADLNMLKKELGHMIEQRRAELENLKSNYDPEHEWLDVTHPVRAHKGSVHPISQTVREAEDIFSSLGFSIVEGPQIEDEYHNFDALNIPAYHPARDLWDTFWLKDANRKSQTANRKNHEPFAISNKLLLRTHTSPLQIRYMRDNQPPLRIIAPGRVFRYEATDATHNYQFWQLEGLMVSDNISVANFKAIINEFFDKFFARDVKVRLRPSYFPFVEPGFEVDANLKGKWLELAGAGMVHPKGFEAAGYAPTAVSAGGGNSKNLTGFAFGIGMDRLAMLKYGIDDVRLLYGGDIRFLRQF